MRPGKKYLEVVFGRTDVSAVCGEYTPAGVLFILARRPVPRPEGGGFVVVGVGEGARGALGHRGTTSPG